MDEIKAEYPDFNKMSNVDIMKWIDGEAKKRLDLGYVENEEEEKRMLDILVALDKITNNLKQNSERVVRLEKNMYKLIDLVKAIANHEIEEHSRKKK